MSQMILAERPVDQEEERLQLQLTALESFNPEPLILGSIKGGMRAINDGVKEAPSRDLWQVDPRKLRVIPGLTPRVRTAAFMQHVRETTQSILDNGFLQHKPLAGIVVEENGVPVTYIYEGEIRLEATLLAIASGADIDKVPVSVVQEIPLNDGSGKKRPITFADMMIQKWKGEKTRQYTVFEQALMVKRLEEQEKMTRTQIAQRLEVSAQQIGNLAKLLAADGEIRYLVATETISGSFAIDTLVKYGDDALRVIRAAMQRAVATNSTTVSAKHMPNHKFNSAVTRAAPKMYSTLGVIKADPNFDKLNVETRELLLAFLAEVEPLKDTDIDPSQVKSAVPTAQLALLGD